MDIHGSADDRLFRKSVYYPGKLLHASDLTREQQYHNSKLEFMNSKFLGWGIIEGLEVQAGRNGSLYLSKGSAVDPFGKILVMPEGRQIGPDEIEGIRQKAGLDFILGIRFAEYAEQTESGVSGKETDLHTSMVVEACALKAYGEQAYRKLQEEAAGYRDIFTEEKILYQDAEMTLALRIPRVVPADSLFKICMEVRAAEESNVRIGWRGMAKLQGAFFVQSGESSFLLEEEQATCSGILQREWDICTEEDRRLPVLLEIGPMQIAAGKAEAVEIPGFQLSIETAALYDRAVRKYLKGRDWESGQDWVPLARLRLGEDGAMSLVEDGNVRSMVVCPRAEEAWKRIAEENGILDIRWRKLLKCMWRMPMPPGPPMPLPPHPEPPMPLPPHPEPPIPPMPFPTADVLTEERFWELVDADRGGRIHKGIIVVPVPRNYKRGQVLLSEEIAHGFPGEEVLLRCGRVWEEPSYAYWEKDQKRYRVIHGDEELFPDACGGQEIVRQAVLQNVEEGTFQVALTLNKKWHRRRSKEVAISWIAVRLA